MFPPHSDAFDPLPGTVSNSNIPCPFCLPPSLKETSDNCAASSKFVRSNDYEFRVPRWKIYELVTDFLNLKFTYRQTASSKAKDNPTHPYASVSLAFQLISPQPEENCTFDYPGFSNETLHRRTERRAKKTTERTGVTERCPKERVAVCTEMAKHKSSGEHMLCII